MSDWIRFLLSWFCYGLGFWLCDGTFWKEFVLAMLLIVGSLIQDG